MNIIKPLFLLLVDIAPHCGVLSGCDRHTHPNPGSTRQKAEGSSRSQRPISSSRDHLPTWKGTQMTNQENYIKTRIEALAFTRECAANRRLELARLTYSTESSGLGAVLDKQRAAYNDHILAAQAILAAIARDSDLFLCPTCEEHFTSHEATPTCSRCKTYKVLNVPEETIYCGTCNRGADSVDEDGCCSDCAAAFERERPRRYLSNA